MSSGEDSENLNDPDFLSSSASKFTPRDARSLRVRFRSAGNVGEVIPQIMPVNRINVPQAYILQGVNRNLLQNQDINVVQLSPDNYVRTFIKKLHKVVKNAELDIGTSESLTDTLVAHLLFRVFDFDRWPLGIELHYIQTSLHPKLKFKVGGDVSLKAIPEFVVRSHNYILLMVGDKHLRNTGPTNDYGEPQIAAEMLACGNENVRTARVSYDVTVFVVRVISTYVTFYRATIKEAYWNELANGCPQNQSITVARWPASSDPHNGLDLAEPNGRQTVLEALCKLYVVLSEYRSE